ncbi:MAG: hypothetical protein QF890_12435 [Myxococcota bacterium]|jgi:hypothetical protein|nr:hypothetical protein [Deltaproteobacteria bacterium]MCP4239737.1 hypothetical protein [bacterium]MDP6074456.1 hypothetical protein [Myxococcota bacterium]MDP6241700.1 hypothetical protein [Myxococcota bacterium]MDP7073841.1 hypothetical protein [Myxococcota bacterium]
MAATQASIVEEGRERLSAARGRIDEEIQRVQEELNDQRKRLESQFAKNRKSFEKQTRRQVKQIQRDLRKNPVVKELRKWRGRAESQFGDTVESLLATLRIASKDDVNRINRKLSRINKRLVQMERENATSSAGASASA